MLSALSSPMLDEAVLAKERRRGEQGDAVTVDSICGTEPDRSRDISHRGGQRHDGNVVEHASGEIAMHDDSRPCLVHLGQPDLARPPRRATNQARASTKLPPCPQNGRGVVAVVGSRTGGHEHLCLHRSGKMVRALKAPQRPAAGCSFSRELLLRGGQSVNRAENLKRSHKLARVSHQTDRMPLPPPLQP